MASTKGTGAASREVSARLEGLLGGEHRLDKPQTNDLQFKSSRAAFARDIAAAVGPRLACQSWQRLAQGGAR